MKNVTLTPMNLVTMILTGILCLGLSGCEAGNTTSAEVVSPTGCNKSQGRYFDPQTKVCRAPKDQHEALVLNAYRYVNQLAEENKLKEVEYDIGLKKYLVPSDAEKLWSELRSKGAKMEVLAGALPDGHHYSPGDEKENATIPKIWGGEGTATGCGWSSDRTYSDNIMGMLTNGLKGADFKSPLLTEAVLKKNECRIYHFVLLANPKVMKEWWDAHLNEIDGVQPQLDTFDKTLPDFGPVEPTKEKK